jgi:hypothetical protein
MVSVVRYIRQIRRVGVREWWRQMQYIGDVKAGTFAGKDQSVAPPLGLSCMCGITNARPGKVWKPLL